MRRPNILLLRQAVMELSEEMQSMKSDLRLARQATTETPEYAAIRVLVKLSILDTTMQIADEKLRVITRAIGADLRSPPRRRPKGW